MYSRITGYRYLSTILAFGKTVVKPNRLTFADRVQQVVQDDGNRSGQAGQDQAYIASLDVASVERKNKTRIIEVKHGDSLCKIAERTYCSRLR